MHKTLARNTMNVECITEPLQAKYTVYTNVKSSTMSKSVDNFWQPNNSYYSKSPASKILHPVIRYSQLGNELLTLVYVKSISPSLNRNLRQLIPYCYFGILYYYFKLSLSNVS